MIRHSLKCLSMGIELCACIWQFMMHRTEERNCMLLATSVSKCGISYGRLRQVAFLLEDFVQLKLKKCCKYPYVLQVLQALGHRGIECAMCPQGVE